ncbi:hypothetical protein Tco_0600739 [Tanacetum coccineum]
MDDPNITMEEYIKFEEEKARRRGRLFNWKTATYGKIRVDDGLYDLGSVDAEFPAIPMTSYIDDLDFFKDFENEFPTIVYNDAQTSKSDLLTEPILNLQYIDEFDLNDETSLSGYDEEEQNILYFNDIFPFNIIRPDNLKSEKDNDKIDIDLTQSLLDNEIIHGSTMLFETSHDKVTKTLKMKSFFINLKVKIMIWKYYANGMLFHLIMNLYAPFGVSLNPKRYYKDGDCAIMLRRLRYVFFALFLENWSPRMDTAYSDIAPFPPREQIHQFLMYEGLEYSDADITDFNARLARIHRREVHRVLVFDFGGLPDFMAEGLTTRMLMEHRDDQGVSLFTSRAEGGFLILGDHCFSWEELRGAGSARQIPDKGNQRDYWIGISSARDFLGTTPSYTAIWDPILRLCHRLIAWSIAGRTRYLRLFAARRKSEAHISGGQFVARLAEHFGLLTAEILGGLTVIAPKLLIIDMAELVRLQICVEINDTWSWVAMGPERQPDAPTGAPAIAEDAPAIGEGDQAS